MAELPAPRTLLEALVRQRQLSWDEAADLIVKTAKEHEDIYISLSGRHLGRLARGERSGNRPNPATRRALRYTFNRPVEELLGPYTLGDLPIAEGQTRGGNGTQARDAIERAEQAWDQLRPNELDEMGGIATFSRPRQLYFAADALVWLPDEFSAAEDLAHQAVEAYTDPADPDWAFGDAAGSHTALAIARIGRAEIDGAADALTPVLDLPAEQRINGIVHSVNRAHRALSHTTCSATARELQERIESYVLTPARALAR